MAIRELCRAASCRDGRHGPGARSLCPSCRDRLVRTLDSLPVLYADCVRGVAPSVVRVIRRAPARVGSPSPGGADIRSAIRAVLASWAGLVAGERGITPPARDVPALARFLGRHADWLSGHSTAGDLVEEIQDLAGTARALAYPDGVRRMHVGGCPDRDCDGDLVALVRTRGGPPAEIVCSVSPDRSWPVTAWSALARQTRARGEVR